MKKEDIMNKMLNLEIAINEISKTIENEMHTCTNEELWKKLYTAEALTISLTEIKIAIGIVLAQSRL